MNTNYSFKTAIGGLETNKTRTILTTLGIVIGITSIIMVMSLGKGAQNLILNQIKGMGAKLIEIGAGRKPSGPNAVFSLFADSLKQSDLESLQKKTNVPHAEDIMPFVFSSEVASYGTETYMATVYGVSEIYTKIYNLESGAITGRSFSEDEVKSYADVVVIGKKVKEELFGNQEDVLGEKIRIKGKNYRIIGVIGKTGQVFVNFDDVVVAPYTTVQTYLLGIKYFSRLIVETDLEENVEETKLDIEETLRNNHNITDPEKDDFNVSTQAEAMEQVSTITNVLTWFLAAVAAISLVVGGVGIMNIMLVSVTERTREIGLRKAVGATNKDIMRQFLFESIILTVLGGVVGIILGSSLSFLSSLIISKVLGQVWPFSVPISSILLGVGVSALVGLGFGLYPARKAANKNPIDALRYE